MPVDDKLHLCHMYLGVLHMLYNHPHHGTDMYQWLDLATRH